MFLGLWPLQERTKHENMGENEIPTVGPKYIEDDVFAYFVTTYIEDDQNTWIKSSLFAKLIFYVVG